MSRSAETHLSPKPETEEESGTLANEDKGDEPEVITESKKPRFEFGEGDNGATAARPEPSDVAAERASMYYGADDYDQDIYKKCNECGEVYSYGYEQMCSQGGGREYNSKQTWTIYSKIDKKICGHCLAKRTPEEKDKLKAEKFARQNKEAEEEAKRWKQKEFLINSKHCMLCEERFRTAAAGICPKCKRVFMKLRQTE